jgi:hypothetical protein
MNYKVSGQLPPLEVPTDTIKTAAYAAVPNKLQTDFKIYCQSQIKRQNTK